MTEKKVLIFLGDEKCGACKIFRPAWEGICNNKNIADNFHIVTFMGNGNVGKRIPGEKLLILPGAFSKYDRLPTLLIVSAEEYNKRWDLETGQEVNRDLPLIGKSLADGIVTQQMVDGKMTAVPNTKYIVDWIYRNR